MKIPIDLRNKIKNKEVILFVGAGVSKNVGLPDFAELIDAMASNLNIDSELFKLYGDFWTLAEYYCLLKKDDKLTLFKRRLKNLWEKEEIIQRIKDSNIYKRICDLGFPSIYTTNYDKCLEKAFAFQGQDYIKISNIEDMSKIKPTTTQIIKYHGDIDSNKNDWVLTESSYFERLSFEHPLDIKFRADSLAKPVLFIGYSLNDMNIRYLLYKLTRAWVNVESRPKSYIFLTQPNMVQEEVLKSWGIEAIIAPPDLEPSLSLEKFLKAINE